MGKILFLGIIQGLTEFLPVSSSGHLLFSSLLIFKEPFNLPFVVSAHIGTLVAILIYFRRTIRAMICSLIRFHDVRYASERSTIWHLIIATVPAIVAGLGFGSRLEGFSSMRLLGLFWVLNGIILCLGEIRSITVQPGTMNAGRAFIIGCFQAIAILPGLSRSGMTIISARNLGISEDGSFSFSFLLGIIAIAGGLIFELHAEPGSFSWNCVGVAAVSFVAGYRALHLFAKMLCQHRIKFFGFYTIVIGCLAILLGRNQ
jgi:undecaprenyl-diphosphatase